VHPSIHEYVINKLEYPSVLDLLSNECRFSLSVARALEIRPSVDATSVRQSLDVTEEAVDLISQFPDVTVGGARDIRAHVERASKGGRLQPADLLQVLDMLVASRTLRTAFERLPAAAEQFPCLHDFAQALASLPAIETDIARAISGTGDVLDTASEALGRIRREIRVAHGRLMERLNRIVSGGAFASILQDAIITIRDGRYVVPIKADARAQVPGVVHDVSSSGQTLFVEPLDVVDLNNRWRQAQLEEQREIERILDALSQKVGSYSAELKATVEAVAEIDLAMAKGRLALKMNATRPLLNRTTEAGPHGHDAHCIDFLEARHPLLPQHEVVPIDIEIGSDYRVLIITGPNTGGKTVALKTLGLLVLMAQSGLFIPAKDRSVTSVFPHVFVDIGDDQSIAQSLSTFSAHMRTVIAMLNNVSSESLVLLDELGAGTDPQEGSALARSLIAQLLELGPLVVATTHFSEVKAFAFESPGVQNASVEFDVATLSPTYRLAIGVPGQSNALAIARRLGMPGVILDRAASMLDPNDLRADVLLQQVQRKRDEANRLMARAEEERRLARESREQAEQTRQEAEHLKQLAREEVLAESEETLATLRAALRRLERTRDAGAAAQPLAETKAEVERADDLVKEQKRAVSVRRKEAAKPGLEVGDRVEILSLGQEGELLSIDSDGAEVSMGALKLRMPLQGLRRIGAARKETTSSRVSVPRASGAMVPIEIDVRGMRAYDAETEIERYLDAAVLSDLPYVRIIHGKGTGALRTAVRNLLNQNKAVVRHEPAGRTEGGDGATIAYFNER
jgi:DNA mismatch repair protein MutS2